MLVFGMCSSTYNSAISKDEGVKAAWSQVENQYQRRADLIPNLVNTVKGYADFEKSTLEAVIQARASATQVKVDPNQLTPENIQRFEQAQQGLSGALGRLLVVSENYPDLKANQNFMDLQKQLEGTENRISVERKNFNTSVQDYNSYIRRFPTNLLVGMFGFSPKGYFQSQAGAERAPEVKF
jgi:LemA protein